MTKQELYKEISALRREIQDHKHRCGVAIDELSGLALGLGIKPTWNTDSHVDWMKNKAAIALTKIAKMPLREAP